jgi:serine/threonine protein kinase
MAPLYTSSALGDERSRAPEFAKDEGPLPSPSWHLFRILDSAMSATDHLPSTLGPYRLQDRLGEAGMGVVHLARDPQGGLVAIKVLRPNTMESANARLRLAREVESMRRVRSVFVAEVLDADVTGEFPYIVTRYVPGPTLEAMVRSRGPLSGSGLRKLVYGTAEALAAIHAAGVVHRNLEPANVMFTDDRPVVIDFGIAQSLDATRLTQTGVVMGTPGYLAPECIEGQLSSPASDVHAWGATMAFAATGRPPFGTGSYQTIFYRTLSDRADLEGVPGTLVPLLSAALARDPARRPPATWLSAQARTLDLSALDVAPIGSDFRDPPGEPVYEYREDGAQIAELERAAKEWDRENHHEDYLFRGDRLVRAQLATAEYPKELAKLPAAVRQLINDFLKQSAPAQQLKVFLCHSSSDKLAVRQLYGQLRAINVLPWLDERDILPGEDWDFEIRRAIRASQAILVCLSQSSITKRGYVQREIKNALDIADEQPEGVIFLIPLRLEECEVPDRLRRWQWVDLFQQNGFEQLARALRKLAEPDL